MTWNNRIFKHKYNSGSKLSEYYTIHEAFYDDNGKLDAWTENAVEPRGDTVDDLINHLQQMLDDAKRSKQDVIDYETSDAPTKEERP